MDKLDAVIRRSHETPVLVFKHSSTCGTSAYAFDELQQFQRTAQGVEIVVLDVFADRAACQALARHSGIRHESPQALLIVSGVVRWHASHYRVTAETLARVVEGLLAAPS